MNKNDFVLAVNAAVKAFADAGIDASFKVKIFSDGVYATVSTDYLEIPDMFVPASPSEAPEPAVSASTEAPGAAQDASGDAVAVQEPQDAPVAQVLAPVADLAPFEPAQAPDPVPESPISVVVPGIPDLQAAVVADASALASAVAVLRGDTDAGAGVAVLAIDRTNVASAQARLDSSQVALVVAQNSVASGSAPPSSLIPLDHDGVPIPFGATVILNSGGPDMEVTAIAQDGTLTCSWTEDGGPEQFDCFAPATVTIKKER